MDLLNFLSLLPEPSLKQFPFLSNMLELLTISFYMNAKMYDNFFRTSHTSSQLIFRRKKRAYRPQTLRASRHLVYCLWLYPGEGNWYSALLYHLFSKFVFLHHQYHLIFYIFIRWTVSYLFISFIFESTLFTQFIWPPNSW